jgi:RimJ/RimL family protein N-acetyltransferase
VRHDIRLRGHAYEIRPVDAGDAEFMLQLRTDPQLSELIHPTSPRLDDQLAYLERHFQTVGDCYFIVIRSATGRREGAAALYDIDRTPGQAEWGRWIMRHDSMGAPEAALLIYRVGFDVLGLNRIYCRTAVANTNVVAFHTACGLETNADAALTHDFGGVIYEAVEQFVSRDRWPAVAGVLDERARAVARLLAR